MWTNMSAEWGEVGVPVTPQWYELRAVERGVSTPEIGVTRIGIIVDGVLVAVPSTE